MCPISPIRFSRSTLSRPITPASEERGGCDGGRLEVCWLDVESVFLVRSKMAYKTAPWSGQAQSGSTISVGPRSTSRSSLGLTGFLRIAISIAAQVSFNPLSSLGLYGIYRIRSLLPFIWV